MYCKLHFLNAMQSIYPCNHSFLFNREPRIKKMSYVKIPVEAGSDLISALVDYTSVTSTTSLCPVCKEASNEQNQRTSFEELPQMLTIQLERFKKNEPKINSYFPVSVPLVRLT